MRLSRRLRRSKTCRNTLGSYPSPSSPVHHQFFCCCLCLWSDYLSLTVNEEGCRSVVAKVTYPNAARPIMNIMIQTQEIQLICKIITLSIFAFLEKNTQTYRG